MTGDQSDRKNGIKILLVDDSKTARLQLRSPLESEGYTVLEGTSGVEGLALVAAHKDPIGLIVTDQNMPNKTGIEMVRDIRLLTGNINASCPVVFLTSDSSPEIREACMILGAKAIVLKPVKPEVLIAAIKKILARAAAG
jgi:two-component system chemotaxis response regulator CheY